MQRKYWLIPLSTLIIFISIVISKLSNPFGPLFLFCLNMLFLNVFYLIVYAAIKIFRIKSRLKFTGYPLLIFGLIIVTIQSLIWIDYRFLIPNSQREILSPTEYNADLTELLTDLKSHPKIDSISQLFSGSELQKFRDYDPDPDKQLVKFMMVIAKLNDGHSFMHPFQLYPKHRFFPFNGYYFDDGYYIVRTAAVYERIQYSRLISINGVPFESVFAKMKLVIGADNLSYQKAMLDIYLFSATVLHGLGIINNSNEATIRIMNQNGVAEDLAIESEPMPNWLFWTLKPVNDSRPVNPALRIKKYDLKINGNDLIFYFNMIQNQSTDNTIKQLAAEIDALLGEKQINRLIIDLRSNNGGDNTLYQPLIDVIRMHPQLNDSLHLFALISRRTFSAAVNFIDDLQLQTHVTLVGEAPGAPATHYGDAANYKLSKSKLGYFISTKQWPAKSPANGEWDFVIDIPIRYTISDFIENRDPWLEKLKK